MKSGDSDRLEETITLSQAKQLIRSLAHRQSILLLSPPGVGKSDTVIQAAAEARLACRSLLGTQIAPEDVSGIPRIVGERSVFCPPRILLPEDPEPFCLFLDELPACAPDIQKAFYSLLLERRIGEHLLPEGTWVVAAGNRIQDRSLVRAMSSALINRVFILHVRVDVKEWLAWADANKIRADVMAFITFMPEALMRDIPPDPVPFSTPRSWASLSMALDQAESAEVLTPGLRRALAFGRVSASDAVIFCTLAEEKIQDVSDPKSYVLDLRKSLPKGDAACWFLLCRVREMVKRGGLNDVPPMRINKFLLRLPQEHRFALILDLVEEWGKLGAEETLLESLKAVTGFQ